MKNTHIMQYLPVLAFFHAAAAWAMGAAQPLQPSTAVVAAEQQRIDVVNRVTPSVVCIFDRSRQSGGSGVLIDAQGHGLTNFHVVAGMAEERRGWGGLSDGQLYELEVLGIDPTGDIAMFRLTGRDSFPFSTLADSDSVRLGDGVLAIGNPFSLSEDYTPTVTRGMVTGLHRYQWGVGKNLVYSDCIQVDASINPGNSGGPLYDMNGGIIGINGRISVDTRGRLNVGFGYAISSNQIRRFLPGLRAGLLVQHGTLGMTVTDDEGAVVGTVAPGGAADRAGVQSGDRLVRLGGAVIDSANRFVSVQGTIAAAQRLPIDVDRGGVPMRLIARPDPIEPELSKPFEPDAEAAKRQMTRVIKAFQQVAGISGRRTAPCGEWSFRLTRHRQAPDSPEAVEQYEVTAAGDRPIRMTRVYEDQSRGRVIEFDAAGAKQKSGPSGEAFDLPEIDGLMLAAMHRVHSWLVVPFDESMLEGASHEGGDLLWPLEPGTGTNTARQLEVLVWPVMHRAKARFGFDLDNHRLIRIDLHDEPSEIDASIEFKTYRESDGLVWPHEIESRFGDHTVRDVLSEWELSCD